MPQVMGPRKKVTQMVATGPGYTRRGFLRDVAVLGGSVLVLGACTSTPAAQGPGPGAGAGRGGGRTAGLPDIEGATVITDPAAFPKTFREAPDFGTLVAQGKLPPVADRIGKTPLVLKPAHGVGQYGGQIRRGFLGQTDFQNAVRFCSGPDSLLYWDYTFEKLVPNLAAGYELSDNDTVLTVHLREGAKWSDGTPFSADDIIFWREDVSLHPELGTGSVSLRIGGKEVSVQKVDDLTVRYTSSVPNPLLPFRMAGWTEISGIALGTSDSGGGGYLPKHYLSKFHPKYNPDADEQAVDAGFKGWVPYFRNQTAWHRNPDQPTMAPWMVTRPINKPPWEFAANPYSIWVDNEGHQLPYIQKITMSNVENLEVLGFRAAAGEFDVQDRHLGVTNLPVLLENEKKSGYTLHRAPTTDLDLGIRLNLAYDADAELGELIRTVEFRRALSLAIDRNQINEAFFLGTSVPSATMVAEGSIYDPGPEWRTKWATFDPAQANALLDKLELTAKDGDGYRLRRDGKGRIRLDYQVGTGHADFIGIGEMIKRQWQPIGIDMTVAGIEGSLLVQRTIANQLMLSAHQVGTDDPFLRSDTFLPTVTNNYPGMIGIPYAQWFGSGGTKGKEPPASLKLLKDAMDLYQKGQSASESERIEMGKELYRMHADQVWSIGLVGFGFAVGGVQLANNNLRNVPARVVNTLQMRAPANSYPMTFYYG